MVYPSTDSELVLVPGKAVLVRVNVTDTKTNVTPPAGKVRVETTTGTLIKEFALTAPTGNLPQAVPTTTVTATNAYTATIPAANVTTGIRLTVTLDGGQTKTITPRVGGAVAIKFVAVPVQIAGTTATVLSGLGPLLAARLPVSGVTVQNHATYVSTKVTTLPTTEDAWTSAFSKVLQEMDSLSTLEGAPSTSYYFAFIPKRTYGQTGIGYVGAPAAVGVDMPSDPDAVRTTVIHEVGHNVGLNHAPCGGPSDADPKFPYANAMLGAGNRRIWGYAADTNKYFSPYDTKLHDVMSYCDGETFSDYNYRQIQVFLTPSDARVTAQAAVEPQSLMLFSGEVRGDQVNLSPVKTLTGKPNAGAQVATAGYKLRVTTAQGSTDYPLQLKSVDHDGGLSHFNITVPHPGTLQSVSVLRGNQALQSVQAATASTATNSLNTRRIQAAVSGSDTVTVQEANGQAQLSWDSARWPYLTVTHVGSTRRSTLVQDAQGGRITLSLTGLAAGGSYEFSLSDGLNSQTSNRAR